MRTINSDDLNPIVTPEHVRRMKRARPADRDERAALSPVRELADRAFSRAAGAPQIGGNSVRLLHNGNENYSHWLDAIRAAHDHVHFECYFIQDDDTGREFAEAFIAKVGEGVRVRLIYDWVGGFGRASRKFWRNLRAAGVEVRCYNPPRLSRPLGWVTRDHRKSLTVDNEIGFISGLCVGNMWIGDPEQDIEPWRDTGVEIRGPAVIEIARAFARTWESMGDPIPDGGLAEQATDPAAAEKGTPRGDPAVASAPAPASSPAPAPAAAPAGDVSLRIVATEPATAGMLRLDNMVAALARHRLWLTDAYYAGTTLYVQALRAAAQDGVDVRLLVPNATDIPLLRPLSRAGYRPLLEAGVRVFEWNGTMMHAKTAVADGRWARIGSTNLNIASWLGNCELDVVVEDHGFATQMEEMFVRDLATSTEVVLDARRRVRTPGAKASFRPGGTSSGKARRATAGAMRIGNAIGAAFLDRRVLGPVEARLATMAGIVLCALSVLAAFFPRALAYPLVALGLWGGLALLWRGVQLGRVRKPPPPA